MILDTIVAHKRIELEGRDKQRMPLDTLKTQDSGSTPDARLSRFALSVPNMIHLNPEVKKNPRAKGIIRRRF